MWKRFLAIAGAVTALASVLSAAQLHVPGNYTQLQDAIDNAQPGDTIIVHGGVFDPIRIDKPLTIVGAPRPWIRFDTYSSPPSTSTRYDVRLQGDGSGVVVLSNLLIGGGLLKFGDEIFEGPVLWGGGFEELHINSSILQASDFPYIPDGDCCYAGQSAVSTGIAQIFVSHSYLSASSSDSGVCGHHAPPAGAGISAPGSTVVLLGSTVVGGGVEWTCSQTGCDPDYVRNNLLAPGVSAQQLFEVNSDIRGGSLDIYFSLSAGTCPPVPDADPLAVVQHVPFPVRMRAFTDLRLGQRWIVYWAGSPGSSFSTLFLSTKALMPPLPMASGWLFLDFAGLLPPRTVYGTATRRFEFHVPVNSSLIGLEVFAQAYDPVAGLTHPIADCVGPQLTAQQVAPTQSL